MKILIIGGTQFIGPHVVRNLVQLGHEITVFHRGENNKLDVNVNQILGDRNHLSEYSEEFSRLSPDLVLDMIPYIEQHADDLLSVFKGITGRIVAISSGDVYFAYDVIIRNELGPITEGPISERSPLRKKLYPYRNKGNNDYDKIPIEHKILNNDIPGTVLRLPVVYGPHDGQHRFFNYVKRMDDKRPHLLLEQGFADFRWTHGYVEDVAHAITLAVTKDIAKGKVYNVGQQNALTMYELVAEVGKASGWSGEIIKADREALPPHLRFDDLNTEQSLVYDTSLIRSELGYREQYSLQEGLLKTIEWERSNPIPYKEEDFNYQLEDEIYCRITT
ncbi:NAD-dependent epimerase/dehydratase family protein [Paenibacillus xylaniclasticus]|uniref:NAD-dependent epimerase/dehydratase family protein n=1 Tax=Paenibacillus xylaniclasticus TaxID=588083 RepID=UPI000FD76C30|nr:MULTISPECIES: NAD-dependent epimerase/dehydratase family protein [Paenibacillus]GFN33163.1 epimerase [Paenibacillus curdlanolyticus]